MCVGIGRPGMFMGMGREGQARYVHGYEQGRVGVGLDEIPMGESGSEF
jgi:hypothetical protein